MTEIHRSVPDIGYLSAELFADLGIVQTVVAGDTVYVSGIAPLTDAGGEVDVVSTDLTEQLKYVLEMLDRSLTAAGTDRSRLVAWTIYTTDMPGLARCVPLLRDWTGQHRPTSTWIGCASFIHPQQLLELTATAVR
ncbi:RidA family protein [Mycobacterium sp. AMU20-3851]|uniref:RidA family protein n=1 Tax=Mycobacterium sp. AMU20-3851 TaxID=3122055 RepID=UPI0037545A47